MSAIPLADARVLRPAADRTLRVLAALALAVATVVGAAAFVARKPHSHTLASLPPRTKTIIVLDLSASISADTFSRIGHTLSQLVANGGRYGLVVFSDDAYEALPPGTPASDIAPMVRYFTAAKVRVRGRKPVFPKNPWNDSFSAGTKISAGLELGHTLAVATGSHRPNVILVSDLDDNLPDVPHLVSVIQAYRRDHVPLGIVGLDPTRPDAALFKKLTAGAPIVNATRGGGGGPQQRSSTPFPWILAVLIVLAAAGVAAQELWAPRLEGGR